MTRDDVIRLAREAHMHHMAWDDDYIEGTERFAALVAAATCKELADEAERNGNAVLAAQLRARGEKP